MRTYKTNKSRQPDDLERPCGTERVSFHKSALMGNQANNGTKNKTHMEEDVDRGVPAPPKGYRRPAGSVNTSQNAVTVRVQSHSQPPLENPAADGRHH